MPVTTVSHLASTGSDHCPLLMESRAKQGVWSDIAALFNNKYIEKSTNTSSKPPAASKPQQGSRCRVRGCWRYTPACSNNKYMEDNTATGLSMTETKGVCRNGAPYCAITNGEPHTSNLNQITREDPLFCEACSNTKLELHTNLQQFLHSIHELSKSSTLAAAHCTTPVLLAPGCCVAAGTSTTGELFHQKLESYSKKSNHLKTKTNKQPREPAAITKSPTQGLCRAATSFWILWLFGCLYLAVSFCLGTSKTGELFHQKLELITRNSQTQSHNIQSSIWPCSSPSFWTWPLSTYAGPLWNCYEGCNVLGLLWSNTLSWSTTLSIINTPQQQLHQPAADKEQIQPNSTTIGYSSMQISWVVWFVGFDCLCRYSKNLNLITTKDIHSCVTDTNKQPNHKGSNKKMHTCLRSFLLTSAPFLLVLVCCVDADVRMDSSTCLPNTYIEHITATTTKTNTKTITKRPPQGLCRNATSFWFLCLFGCLSLADCFFLGTSTLSNINTPQQTLYQLAAHKEHGYSSLQIPLVVRCSRFDLCRYPSCSFLLEAALSPKSSHPSNNSIHLQQTRNIYKFVCFVFLYRYSKKSNHLITKTNKQPRETAAIRTCRLAALDAFHQQLQQLHQLEADKEQIQANGAQLHFLPQQIKGCWLL
ncbi:uncharacterized protein LOC129890728 [Solanum dulcamara]|uniref:uncharacterized protein LOC129890728 n=1 Tax=Solanum dulcamara TaxID=45834 RepID=UPI002485D796|nr:uncharacterized protein LOC129890728 [Solanum dulcamara]